MEKSVNKSTLRRIVIRADVENLPSPERDGGAEECLKIEKDRVIFVENARSNHLFDSKMNLLFAK